MNEEESQSKEIYRKVPLERLSHPEQLDSLLVVVPRKAWVALIALLSLASFALIWAFFGSIPIKIEGKGIIMNQKGELFNIQTKFGGVVREINVNPGNKVEKGDQVALIEDPEEQLKLERANIKVASLERNYEELKQEIEIESKAQIEAQKSELTAKEFTVAQTEKRIVDLEKEVERRQRLYNEGLVSHNILIETEERLSKARIDLELAKSAIATLRYNLAKGYRTEELKSKEHEVLQALEERDLLKTRQPYFQIFSPFPGNVLGLLASEGDIVQSGAPLLWMEHTTDEKSPYVIYGYFPVEKGKRIAKGTDVKISVSTVDPQEYGYLLGTVEEISAYAVSKEGIARIIHNKELVEYLSQETAAVIQTIVTLNVNPETGQYLWTSGKIPPVKISTGTVCTLQGIIHRVRPIYYILPIESFKLIEAQ